MLVAAEGLLGRFLMAVISGQFQLERAELLVDDLPDDLVGGHLG